MAYDLGVYPTGETLGAAFRRSLVADRCINTRASRAFVGIYDFLRVTEYSAVESKDPNVYEYLRRVSAVQAFMRFCITEKGYMGLCSKEAQVGDDIYILPGMATPYTMRRTAGRQANELRLVGRCYIHGIMDGEALTLPGYEPKDIHIW